MSTPAPIKLGASTAARLLAEGYPVTMAVPGDSVTGPFNGGARVAPPERPAAGAAAKAALARLVNDWRWQNGNSRPHLFHLPGRDAPLLELLLHQDWIEEGGAGNPEYVPGEPMVAEDEALSPDVADFYCGCASCLRLPGAREAIGWRRRFFRRDYPKALSLTTGRAVPLRLAAALCGRMGFPLAPYFRPVKVRRTAP